MGLFSSRSSTTVVENTTQQSFDNRLVLGNDTIGLAAGSEFNYNLVNELPDNAVNLLTNFATVIGDVAQAGIKGAGDIASKGQSAVNTLTTQVKASGAAIDIRAIAPYLLGAGALVALYMVFRK
jgi:hypothetical protein